MAKRCWAAHLGPRVVRGDKELDVPMPEDAEDGAPEVPVGNVCSAFEEPSGLLLAAALVPGPCVAAVADGFSVFCAARSLPALVGRETREYEHGFYAQLLECAQVGLDAGRERQREAPRRCQQRFPAGRAVEQVLQVVRSINAQTVVGKRRKWKNLQKLALGEVGYDSKLTGLVSDAGDEQRVSWATHSRGA
ncbi:hypothetical protein EXIGLDRAFT_286606 [Exidia glandulosa HHB12029]|uniref:Uncharacterized protein n=1 Tax=Exidia glandulosa HHB12029 TaxID=1314781 RepID=A0A165M5T7_EXIGL|nr:hypothetical protein EXIGLDRAFT_286606 [Exidia glandulosa HHB12029]